MACTPGGVPALPNVVTECHEINGAMPAKYMTAASSTELQDVLSKVPTKRFIFCGHADAQLNHGEPTLAFTSPTGGLEVVQPDTLSQMLGGIAKRGHLELVFLNGCCSANLGREVIKAGVPNVVCWETLTQDEAARIFSVEFFRQVQQMITQCKNANADYKAAFDLAKSKVESITREVKKQLSNLNSTAPLAYVPKFEFRKPILERKPGGGKWEVSVSKYKYEPKPIAAGVPKLLPEPPAPVVEL